MVKIVEVASLLTVKDNRVLLVRSSIKWTLPGGKIKERETPKECLIRELKEELPFLLVTKLKKFRELPHERCPHSGQPLKVVLFKGKVKGPIITDNEIKEAKWFKLSDIEKKKDEIARATRKPIQKSGYLL